MRRYLKLNVFIILLVTAKLASAHPHVWIDLRIKPLMNEQGNLLGLEQAWRFDPFYSLVLIEELDKGGPKVELEERYDQLSIEIVNNLNGVNFFTQGHILKEVIQWEKVTDFTLIKVGQQLELRFYLPLLNPLKIKELPFTYRIYDPTYYIEMLHATEEGTDSSALNLGCKIKLETPKPSFDLIQKALALDKDATSNNSQLGRNFSEKVTLDCL